MGEGGEAGFALEVIPALDGGDLLRVTLLPCLHMDLVSGRVAVFAGRLRNPTEPSGLGKFDPSGERLQSGAKSVSSFAASLASRVERSHLRKQGFETTGIENRNRLGQRDIATEKGHRGDELKVGVRHGCCACKGHGA